MYEEADVDSAEEDLHQELLDRVATISSRRTHGKQRTEGAAVASEFHLAPTYQDGKVSMASLLKGLGSTQDRALVDLSKKLHSMQEKSRPMEPPLNKIQADRVNREAANNLACKEVGKWAPIVKKNREAEHLSFPLQPDHVPAPSLAMKLEMFTPTTELEKEVAAILSRSEAVKKSEEEELTEAERKSLFQMSIEEAMERKKELQKHRSLMSFYEQRCKRIKRIKSKKFHKVHRKHLEKVSGKKECTDEELVKLRAKERMTLKHSNKAKWARKQQAREHRDPATQQALTEHHQRKTQLKEKLPPAPEDEEEEEEDIVEESEGKGSVSDSRVVFADSRNPWLNSLTISKDESSVKSQSPRATALVQPSTPALINTDVSTSKTGGGKSGGGEEGLGRASKQLLAIREAFAGDDVVEEFEKEKEELEKEATMPDAPTVLPGWGSWGGLGVKASKRKPPKAQNPSDPPKKKPRRDSAMKHVIIAEQQIGKKLAEHLVQSVPWPYTSKKQFDKTHCMPIGRHWNTESTYQQLIQPRVTTKTGEVIRPLELTEEVQKYIEEESSKKEKRRRRTKK